ncbi:hypothetical protein PVAP13_9NG064312 [Panicum virgatum]|uniref:Chaperonin-like RbcX protein n=1 Tax=Panicum virgatum TaxID=38727 RepID=A0A8T0MED8_PANVG|nr:hypothetical protein PVAP13_9NG064312 [Panicum virgatum]
MLRASYVDTSILATASPRESAGGLVADRDEVHTHLQWRALLPCCAAVAPARWWKEQGTRRKERGDGASLAICTQPRGGLGIVCNLGGQYDDTFDDVQLQLMNYFTYKAVRTMLTQLYEMNPPSYRWFYNFVAVNKPTDGKLFLRALSKERQELAERVMVTRLHLYGKWIKKCDHGKMYEMISDENLKLMRERLMETVIWPTDDTNTEKIG